MIGVIILTVISVLFDLAVFGFTAYLVFWMGQAGGWFVLAFLICGAEWEGMKYVFRLCK